MSRETRETHCRALAESVFGIALVFCNADRTASAWRGRTQLSPSSNVWAGLKWSQSLLSACSLTVHILSMRWRFEKGSCFFYTHGPLRGHSFEQLESRKIPSVLSGQWSHDAISFSNHTLDRQETGWERERGMTLRIWPKSESNLGCSGMWYVLYQVS